jgi:hypothetical protein
MRVPPARESGSVMIEALVAVLILAAAAGFWFNTVGGTVERQSGVARRALAMLVASSQLATVGVVAPAAPGTRTGRDGTFDWSIAIAPAPDTDGLMRVDVSVRDARGARLAQLSTLRPAT